MTKKFLLSLFLMLSTVGMIALANAPCKYEGMEYEHRTAMMIEGKCLICFDGEWQSLPYAPPVERCKGKL